MKRVLLRMPSYILFIFLCTFFSTAEDTAIKISVEPHNSVETEKKDTPLLVQITQGENTQQAVRLFPFNQIPDSTEIRKQIIDTWFSAPIETVMEKEIETYTDSKGHSFTVSGKYADDRTGSYAISIIPMLTNYAVSDRKLVAQGTWIIYRSIKTGEPDLIKIYPRENPALSIRIRPASQKAHTGKSFIDICLFNAYVRKDIALGIPFEMLYGTSLSGLKELTGAIIPWTLFDPPLFYSAVEAMSKMVGERLYRLVSLKDACFDHTGKPVHISDSSPQTELEINSVLNIDQVRSEVIGGVDSAGFAKWIIDGIIRPAAGQGTIIESLKLATDVPKTHFTRPYMQSESIFFGLDWIRNLGAATLSLNLNRTVYPAVSGLDVTECPFALTTAAPVVFAETAGKLPAFAGYEQYAGYQTSYLIPLLYYLTITEPGHFYLGCLSTLSGNPPLRHYDHIAVFFPYFDLWGEFHLDVYENGIYIPIADFMAKHADAYTALVRVRAPEAGRFNP